MACVSRCSPRWITQRHAPGRKRRDAVPVEGGTIENEPQHSVDHHRAERPWACGDRPEQSQYLARKKRHPGERVASRSVPFPAPREALPMEHRKEGQTAARL